MKVIQELPVEAFQKYYESWKKCWNIAAEGKYFERDNVDVE